MRIMKARHGQVALLLVVVLVAATVLTLLNVNIFLAVRAKNRTMNAGDAAALAVAKLQGRLLNEIAALNVEHLRAALAGDWRTCDEIVAKQAMLAFIGPLEGIRAGNEAAKKNGITEEASGGMREILLEHVRDIREVFVHNLAFYPEPWIGAWEQYAEALEAQLKEPLYAGPDNVDFVDIRAFFPLYDKAFYNAIAGRMWCWFRDRQELFAYDTEGLAAHYGGPDEDNTISHDRCNSEIYPLNVTFRPLAQIGSWAMITNVVEDLTGASPEEIGPVAALLLEQPFVFYDAHWTSWSAYPGIGFGPETFPVEGEVKAQYDVLGCSATCRVQADADDVLDERAFAMSEWDHLENRHASAAETKVINWNASAKPFGWLYAPDDDASARGIDGSAAVLDASDSSSGSQDSSERPVTAWGGLVVPRATGGAADASYSDTVPEGADAVINAESEGEGSSCVNCFDDVRLVPVDSVNSGISASMADRDWVLHLKYHLPNSPYLRVRYRVPAGRFARTAVSCWYCQQLDVWDRAPMYLDSFRRQGREWLKRRENVKSCERYSGPGPEATGGTIHAH